jgi:lysophospholipase L1-like esterase
MAATRRQEGGGRELNSTDIRLGYQGPQALQASPEDIVMIAKHTSSSARRVAAASILPKMLVLAAAGYSAWLLQRHVRLARQLYTDSMRFEANPPRSAARVLMVGDSTALGTGASSPQASIAGLIAQHHPDVKIVNRARNGARLAEITEQLQQGDGSWYDVILILGGGNDVIRMTGANAIRAAIHRALHLARQQANTVIFMPAGNVGNAPFFPAPFSWLMTHRSRLLHGIARSAARVSGAIYVNGFKEKHCDPFVKESHRLNAKDGLHPSDDGYQLWFEALQQQGGLSQLLSGRSLARFSLVSDSQHAVSRYLENASRQTTQPRQPFQSSGAGQPLETVEG